MEHTKIRRLLAGTLGLLASGSAGCGDDPAGPGTSRLQPSQQFPTILLPAGYQVEKVLGGLTYPTALTFDDQGRMYVAEAGGAFLDLPPAARILRVENGRATEVVNLDDRGVAASLVGLTWHNGAFYAATATRPTAPAPCRA